MKNHNYLTYEGILSYRVLLQAPGGMQHDQNSVLLKRSIVFYTLLIVGPFMVSAELTVRRPSTCGSYSLPSHWRGSTDCTFLAKDTQFISCHICR